MSLSSYTITAKASAYFDIYVACRELSKSFLDFFLSKLGMRVIKNCTDISLRIGGSSYDWEYCYSYFKVKRDDYPVEFLIGFSGRDKGINLNVCVGYNNEFIEGGVSGVYCYFARGFLYNLSVNNIKISIDVKMIDIPGKAVYMFWTDQYYLIGMSKLVDDNRQNEKNCLVFSINNFLNATGGGGGRGIYEFLDGTIDNDGYFTNSYLVNKGSVFQSDKCILIPFYPTKSSSNGVISDYRVEGMYAVFGKDLTNVEKGTIISIANEDYMVYTGNVVFKI